MLQHSLTLPLAYFGYITYNIIELVNRFKTSYFPKNMYDKLQKINTKSKILISMKQNLLRVK